ncbi:MAG: exo-alpha-sialidase [Gemmatimonadetes bacterium]|nr:exo-alpha-sialidase [Gemmatimonadota bacterium]
MHPLLASGILLAQCTGPWCGPDTEYERPAGVLLGDEAVPVATRTSEGAVAAAFEFRAPGGEADVCVVRRESGPESEWSDPVLLDGDGFGTSRAIEPRIAAGAAGLLCVVWQDARSGHDAIWFTRSTDDGRTFERARRLPDAGGEWTASMPALAIDALGVVHVVWEDQRDGSRDLRYARSTDAGVTFSASRRVDSDEAGAHVSYHPLLACAADATVVSWWDERDGLADVYVRRTTDAGGTWAGPEQSLSPGTPGKILSRDVRLSAAGSTVAVAWEQGRVPSGATIMSRVSRDSGATFEEPRGLGTGEDPEVAALPAGRAIVSWWSRAGGAARERTSVGGRIVDIPVPLEWDLVDSSAPRAVRKQPGLDAHESIWMERFGDDVWAARGGAATGRGALEILGAAGAGADSAWQWRPVAILRFGNDYTASTTDVRARSLTGAVAGDGALQLLWISVFGETRELSSARLER